MARVMVPVLFAMAALVCLFSCFGDSNDRYITGDVVNIRVSPSPSGDVKGTYIFGDKVLIIKKSDKTDTVGGKTDYWYYVSNTYAFGWIFGAFMTTVPLKAIGKIDGAYYYQDLKNTNQYSYDRLLTINNETYEETINQDHGTYVLITGKAVKEKNTITLTPLVKVKKGRVGSAYEYTYGYGYNTPENIETNAEERALYSDILTNIVKGKDDFYVRKRDIAADGTFTSAYIKR